MQHITQSTENATVLDTTVNRRWNSFWHNTSHQKTTVFDTTGDGTVFDTTQVNRKRQFLTQQEMEQFLTQQSTENGTVWDTTTVNRKCNHVGAIIIMYIYHAFISALSTHMIHINLNTISYKHLEHSPTKTIYRIIGTHTHTHTHIYTHTHTHKLQWIQTCMTLIFLRKCYTHTHTHNDYNITKHISLS